MGDRHHGQVPRPREAAALDGRAAVRRCKPSPPPSSSLAAPRTNPLLQERSLTTILYLMSLTEEARAPFSLVDEINQGMDQRAERAVHNSLVEVTCRPESGQYFLITPKLLPDLNYHERMKILCVNNGEWLPEEKGLGNMMGLIDHYVRVRQNRGNASA